MTDDRAGGAAPLLSVQDLEVSLRSSGVWRDVLHRICFDVKKGETVALVGESGSGKSITALSVMRLLPSAKMRHRGRIEFEGTDLLATSDDEMRRLRGNRIAMIFQEPMTSLNPVMTVGRQIAEVIVTHRDVSWEEGYSEAAQLLDRVRIPFARSRVNDYPHQFSGGMRQRVMISMALACRPSLLIADEPTTALDVTVQAQILDLMRTLQQEEQMGLLFITHDMGVVAEIADRAVVMKDGRIVESGPVEPLFSAPRHPYSQALLSSVPVLGSMAGEPLPLRFPVAPAQPDDGLPARGQTAVPAIGSLLLEVENLSTRFDVKTSFFGRVKERIHAVENVSFALRQGETLGLVGESGSGKSTIGRSIMRLISPASGRIAFAGRDIGGPSSLREIATNIQMIFQDPYASLNPRMRVGDAVEEPLVQNKICGRPEARRRVDRLLEMVGLHPGLRSRFPHEFSGGQRQRICIARSLALDPSLLIADEAVSALDVSTKAQIVNLMIDLQQAMGISYLFISHDMAVVERISHRVAVMYLGEIVEIGPREAIFANPRHSYTRALIEAVPLPDPSRRRDRRQTEPLAGRSARHPVGYVAPRRRYEEVSPGHLVQMDDGAHELVGR